MKMMMCEVLSIDDAGTDTFTSHYERDYLHWSLKSTAGPRVMAEYEDSAITAAFGGGDVRGMVLPGDMAILE